MSDLSTQLPQRLNRPEETGLDAGLLIPLLRLLVEGDPVTVEQLAAAAGRTLEEVRRGLDAVPDTEYDDQGRIVGQGLSLVPTPHRFTVAGEELYTWCALDTLIFPALLDRPARVESVSPASGEPIRVTVDPAAGVTRVAPATAMGSLVNPEEITSLLLLQPGALLHLPRGCGRVARCPPRRRGGPGGRGLPDRGRPHHRPARPPPGDDPRRGRRLPQLLLTQTH